MSPQDTNDIKRVVREAVAEAIASQSHACRFDISSEQAKELGHLMGMAKDLGDGNPGAGIEIMRDNHKRIIKTRKVSEKIAAVIINTLITSFVVGVIAAIVAGVKVMVVKS